MNLTATRKLLFCAGHRVMGHENKCAHLHGHNYVVLVTARAAELDGIGRVIDFSVLKAEVGGWIEKHWDHGFLLHIEDHAAIAAVLTCFDAEMGPMWVGQKRFLLPYNPTAENIARYILEVVGPGALQGTGVELCKVEVWETPNCKGEAALTGGVNDGRQQYDGARQ